MCAFRCAPALLYIFKCILVWGFMPGFGLVVYQLVTDGESNFGL